MIYKVDSRDFRDADVSAVVNVIHGRAALTTERRLFAAISQDIQFNHFQCTISSSFIYKMPLTKESRMQMAISAYKNKKIHSKKGAAGVFCIPESTLRARLQGRQPRVETRANGHKLTPIEEETLVKRLLYADKRGFLIRPQFLRGMAQILLYERTQSPTSVLGVNWAYSFVKRRPELRTRFNRRITYQHAKQEDPKIIKPWFETIREAIQEHGIHEDDIWNFDETGFAMGLCSSSKIITAVERSERPRRVIQGNREWVTIIECISSKGISISPVVILKAKQHQAAWYQEPELLKTANKDWRLARSDNG